MSTNPFEQKDPSEHASRILEENRLKFAPDGSARPFAGVTVLCHLPDTGLEHTIHCAIIKNCFDTKENELLRDYYVQLPAPSLHMTILDTLVYKRSEADVEDKSQIRAADKQRFRQAFLRCQSELRANLPVRMQIDLSTSRYVTEGVPLTVPVKPCDEQEANKLHAIRNTLGSAFEMPFVDPAYLFHITGYYSLRPLTAEQFGVVRRNWSEAVSRVAEIVPTFEINRVELCLFEDMCHFEVEEFV